MVTLTLPMAARVSVANVVGCEPEAVNRMHGGRITACGMPVAPDHRQQALFWQAQIEFWALQDETLHDLLERGPDAETYKRFCDTVSQRRLYALIQKVRDGERNQKR